MKVLVTGGTGFIGSHLVDTLIERGYEVRCLVRETSSVQNLKELGAELVYGDIADADSLVDAVKDIPIVYHLAAIRGETSLPFSAYRDINVQGVRNILEASCKEGVDQFIYTSTIGVLGWVSNPPANETYPFSPTGKYHITKCEGEKLVLAACQERRISSTIVRPVMTYGSETDGFLFNLAQLIKSGKFKTIGKGNNCLHLVNIANLVQALMLIIDNPNASGNIYIIADEQPIIFNKLVALIAQSLNVNVPKGHVPVWLARLAAPIFESTYNVLRINKGPLISRSKVDLVTKHRFYDITKAKRELGYNPLVDTEDGVKQAIDYYIKNGAL